MARRSGTDFEFLRVFLDVKDNRKTRRLQRRLGIDRTKALGVLLQIWLYAAEYAPDGSLSTLDDEDLCDLCDITGSVAMRDVLRDCELMDDKEVIHGWEELYGFLARNRERERVKKANQRAQGGLSPPCPQSVPNVPGTKGTVPTEKGTQGGPSRRRERRRNTPPKPPPPGGASPHALEADPAYSREDALAELRRMRESGVPPEGYEYLVTYLRHHFGQDPEVQEALKEIHDGHVVETEPTR